MEKRLGRFAAVSFAAALVLEGCSVVTTPSPKQTSETSSANPIPTYNLVNCEKGPFENKEEIHTVKKGQTIKIGGILNDGTSLYIQFTVADKGIGISQDPSFKVFDTSHGHEYINSNLDIITEIFPEPEKSQYTIGASASCIFQAPGPQA